MDEVNRKPLDQQGAGQAVDDSTRKDPASQSTTRVIDITTEDEFSNHTSSFPSSALLVLYFHAPWAAPCKQMNTIISTLATTYPVEDPPNIGFLSINAEDLPDVAEAYDVTAVPYLVLQRNGKTLDTVSGSDAARVRTAVEKHAGRAGNPGKLGIPPAQRVTKSEAQPLSSNSTPSANQTNGASKTNGTSKDLSGYAPTASDPATAPEYTSGEQGGNNKDALFQRLSDLVKAAPVMLFMKGSPSAPQCGFSRQLVSLLREQGVRYGFFNILADDEVRQGLKEFADWPTFPQLWMDGELVGGLDIVKEELGNDPDFLNQYSVSAQRNTGGPASADKQVQPAVA